MYWLLLFAGEMHVPLCPVVSALNVVCVGEGVEGGRERGDRDKVLPDLHLHLVLQPKV